MSKQSRITKPTDDALPRRTAHLGDFTLTPRVLVITAYAVIVGAISALTAWALLSLIGLITNLVFYQRVDSKLVAPGLEHHSAWLILLAPVAGGLIVGLMARFGSEKIRGHGMPEAIEAILTGGSRVAPRIAVLKPISAAVSIGTGGPFGAEGPIIMTGGAVGSMLAQLTKMTADERKTLLVAGAAGGMAATFNSPLAAILLAVELLLFEWRPRSFIPVVASVCVAVLVRAPILGSGPIFPVNPGDFHLNAGVDALCVIAGLTGGLLAVGATYLVYLAEDGFKRLPVHWMWWPAIGGLIIGIGGLIEPRALGVGYDVIDQLLTGKAGLSLIFGILIVKTIIWSLSLGSGTSGGVLAPVFMIGGSLGALQGQVLPHVFPGFWAMMGLAAVVGGVMRSPLTGVIFTLELTHVWGVILPLVIAATTAYAVSCLILKRSVLTEKIARHGLHLTREYSTDPLETFFVNEVMDIDPLTLTPDDTVAEVAARLTVDPHAHTQRLIPVMGKDGQLASVVTIGRVMTALHRGDSGPLISDLMSTDVTTVFDNDTLRHVANVFAEHGVTRAPVVDRMAPDRLLGVISLDDLLHARKHDLGEEHVRERHLLVRRPTVEDD
ncbi:H+/Cl- antiporter ClcA [Antricoccus suffuscus]|uniref:H+/Cl-antiporter ClcA n=1 Tax=Antricoccus suffuscus TaxID=1629062 RepID=A0A2T0ZWH4_9ACTN|nr:chloride channel protein [Antricoccus suffuscus]PRZ40711.1 H+/Cl- antiporter ClcA [Antricoccus suffuscus]